MLQEPLFFFSVDKWRDLQTVLQADWLRSIAGYNVLETQLRWKEKGFEYGFSVYCPYGDPKNGFVAINQKASAYELIIQYPKDDTKILEEMLRTTKIIDWQKRITLAFTSFHVIRAVEKVIDEKHVEMRLLPSNAFILENDSDLFEDVRLPQGFTFGLLTPEHIELIDSKWPHRYPSSTWYFELLIKTQSGYGLYKNGELISWIFSDECGKLTHLYTLEDYRRKGYAEIILKLISNEMLKQKMHVLVFVVKGNDSAYKLYKKIGFRKVEDTDIDVTWAYLERKSNSSPELLDIK